MKRSIIYLIAGSTILLSGGLIASKVYADEVTSDTIPQFVKTVASKIGVDEQVLFEAMQETRTEERTQRQEDRKVEISQAVSEGKLTQRQADILNKMMELREAKIEEEGPREFRQEKRQMRKNGELKDNLLTELNNAGMNVTEEELKELHETMVELGLNGPRGPQKGNQEGLE